MNNEPCKYLQFLNRCAVSLGYSLFVYQSNTDFSVYTDNCRNDVGESYIFDLIDYDIAPPNETLPFLNNNLAHIKVLYTFVYFKFGNVSLVQQYY